MKEQVTLNLDKTNDFHYQNIRFKEYKQSASSRWPLLHAIDRFFISQAHKHSPIEKEFAQSQHASPPDRVQEIREITKDKQKNAKIRFAR